MLLAAGQLYAQSSSGAAQKFKQTLQWSSDPNVLEYKVEIQNSSGQIIQSLTTEESSVSLALKEGTYRYRITAYDFLGREAVSTGWVNFEVAIAKQPEIKHEKKLESLAEDGKSLELDVNVADVTSDTKAELVNMETKARIPGKLILSAAAGAPAVGLSASETHAANKVRFADVPEGKWKLVITNPSGLSTETESFEVKDTIKEERLAAAKVEAERKEKERLEQERIAKEAEEKAKAEAERLAREEAEKEAQRLAIEQAVREEMEKMAAEKAAQEAALEEERRQKEEEERLAREEEERLAREEEERLAKEEEEKAKEEEKEEAKKRRHEKWLTYDRKFYLVAGAGSGLPLYDNGLFGDLMDKKYLNLSLTGQFGFLPIHTNKIRFGIETNVHRIVFDETNQFISLKLDTLILQENLAFRFKLGKNRSKTWIQIKAGGGLALMQESLDYYENTENNKQNKTLNYGYFTAGGGLSLFIMPSTMFVLEVGTDFYNLFIPDTNIGVLTPYAGIGIRF